MLQNYSVPNECGHRLECEKTSYSSHIMYVGHAVGLYCVSAITNFLFSLSGDHLSFNNGKLAHATQSDNGDPEVRLEGLIMAISNFHALMNLLDFLFKTSFTVSILLIIMYLYRA